MPRDNGGRNFRAGIAQMSTAASVLTMGQAEYQAAVTAVLREVFGSERSGVKRLATVADTSVKTARNWLEGECTPGPLKQLRLMAQVPEFQAMVRRLTAMHADMDPMFERRMCEAFDEFQRFQMMRGRFSAPSPGTE